MLDAAGSPPLLLDYPSTRVVQPVQAAQWHRREPKPGKPHVLPNALQRAHEAAPHLDGLARFLLPRLPTGVLASSTIKDAVPGMAPSSRVLSLDAALRHQWLSLNTDKWTNAETADCDGVDWDDRLDELVTRYGMAEPLFNCASPWKGSAHLTWAYDSPVDNEKPHQVRLRRGIKKGLAVAFGSDPRFANRLQKNPWHLAPTPILEGQGNPGNWLLWEAYKATDAGTTYHTTVSPEPRAHAMAELFRPLAAYAADRGITLLTPAEGSSRPVFIRAPAAAAPADSRHGWRVFDAARMRVYRARTADLGTIRGIVGRAAADVGSPADPSDLDGIATSIARFMREDWTGPLDGKPGTRSTRDIDHGAMTREAAADGRLDEWTALSTTERRVQAARRSADLSSGRTDDAIRAAADRLIRAGTPFTQTEIAAASGVSLRTVKRRFHSLSLENTKVPNGPNPPLPPCGAAGGPEAPPLQNRNPSPSLASLAVDDRKVRLTVSRLAAVVMAAMKPGASPPTMPEIPADLSGSPPVRKAMMVARQAIRDAERRAAARAAKDAAAVRFAEFTAAAAGPFSWTWWTNYRAALDDEFDAREQEPGLDRHAVAAVRATREAVFGARWRLWRKVTGPQPVPPPPVESRSARVARMAREDAESIADLDRIFGPDTLSTDLATR